MFQAIIAFFRSEDGQDLADYCLLTAVLALLAAAILFRISGGLDNLWTVANHTLHSGNAAASPPAGSSGSPH